MHCITRIGARRKHIRTWRCNGRGALIHPSSGRSRWRPISAERGKAWSYHGPATSRTWASIRSQFHHIIDIVPTILEAAGIKAPEMVKGIPQKPIEGVSMDYTFGRANSDAPSTRPTQYFEMSCNRGIYHEGWYACTTPFAAPWLLATGALPDVNDYKWELYNVTQDYSQNNDLAEKYPEKLKELQALFLAEAAKYQVFPLDNRAFARYLDPKPSATAGKTVFTYTGVRAGIPTDNAPNILNKDYTITAQITVPEGRAEGMIVTFGGRFGGYGLFLQDGKPVFVYNLLDLERFRWEGGIGGILGKNLFGRALEPGQHTIVFDFKYDGPGPRQGRHRRALGGWQGVGQEDHQAHDSIDDVHR